MDSVAELNLDALDGMPDFDLGALDYGISTVDFVRQALSGYTGGVAIARELIQNADDAKADIISFHLHDDALIVRNSSTFRSQDFKNIFHIASGGKRDEKLTTGTWGTGFVSVYHITDRPELESAGRHIAFNPNEPKPLIRPSPLLEGTLFRLPWRRARTRDGDRIGATIWGDDEVRRLRGEIGASIYALSLFLRHVRIIEVYDGDNQMPWCRVECQQMGNAVYVADGVGCRREEWSIAFKQRGQAPVQDEWLYYRRSVTMIDGVAGIKDREVTIACPIKEREWLAKNVPYRLYNFLPSEVETEYPFHLNGPFFPDNNRKGIIVDDDTNRAQSNWNRHVITGLAELYRAALLDLRDRLPQPRRFFEALPLTVPTKHTYLRPIRDVFWNAAPDLPIARTTQDEWRRPCEVLFPLRTALRDLAASYLPVSSSDMPFRAQEELRKSFGGVQLTWRHIVAYLRGRSLDGISLGNAHPMVNTRESLTKLYGELESAASTFDDADRGLLADVALLLSEGGRLHCPATMFYGDVEVRGILGHYWTFVDRDVQRTFAKMCAVLVDECSASAMIEWLSREASLTEAVSLTAPPAFLGEAGDARDRLIGLLGYIGRDLPRVDRMALQRLPIIRAADDSLVCGADAVYQWYDHK